MTIHKKRAYLFSLPYTISGFEVVVGMGELKDNGIFNKLPKDLQEQMEAANMFTDITVTKKMCDEIDDATWTKIASLLNLHWKYSKD